MYCNVCGSYCSNESSPDCSICGTLYPIINIKEFVNRHCVGKEFDSCKEDSTCPYASISGCTHEMHPKNNRGTS